MCCPISSATARPSPIRTRAARLLGLDLDEDEASLQALYVAGLCGLAQGLAQVMRALEAGGFAFDALVASGGAARGALVRQIVADVCGRRVVTAETEEPVLLGSAMLGAVAAGRYDLPGAMRAMSRLGRDHRARGRRHRGAARAQAPRLRDPATRRARDPRRARSAAWPKLVIFDCDGVLVDSEPISLAHHPRARSPATGSASTKRRARDLFLGISSASRAQNRRGAARRARCRRTFEADLARDVIARIRARACAGSPACARRWRRWAGRSASPPRARPSASRRVSAIVGYADLFGPRVFSAHEVANGKPAPDLLLHAAAQLGVAPADCLVVEDSVAGVTAARRARA